MNQFEVQLKLISAKVQLMEYKFKEGRYWHDDLKSQARDLKIVVDTFVQSVESHHAAGER